MTYLQINNGFNFYKYDMSRSIYQFRGGGENAYRGTFKQFCQVISTNSFRLELIYT